MSETISKFHPSKFKYSKFNIEFCIECQDTREVLGHSSIDCPEMICKNCSVKGHHAGICPQPTIYWPKEAVIGQFSTDTAQQKVPKQDSVVSKISKRKRGSKKLPFKTNPQKDQGYRKSLEKDGFNNKNHEFEAVGTEDVYVPDEELPKSYRTMEYTGNGNNSWGYKGFLDFVMEPKNRELPHILTGKVRICRTSYETPDYEIIEKYQNNRMKNKIVTLKFLARSDVKMVDPNVLKLMFVCQPINNTFEETFVYKSSKMKLSVEAKDIVLNPQQETNVATEIRQNRLTLIKKLELIIPGLALVDPGENFLIKKSLPQLNVRVRNSTDATIYIRNNDAFGVVAEGEYGTSVCLTFDEENKKLHVKTNVIRTKQYFIKNFDPKKKPPQTSIKKHPASNRYQYFKMNFFSYSLLQTLKWPSDILFFFENSDDAYLCLRTLFPKHKMLEFEHIRIRVKIMPFDEIDWDFQSSLHDFENFPSKTIQEFVKTEKLKKEFVTTVKRKHLNSLKTENENYKKKRIPR